MVTRDACFPSLWKTGSLGWLSRAGGAFLLVSVAAAWASLLTWSQSDPSLTHAADGAPTQRAGRGRRHLRRRDAQHARLCGGVPAARPDVLGPRADARRAHLRQPQEDEPVPARPCCCSPAGSQRFPLAAGWPFAHSFGGIVGDWLYKLTATLFAIRRRRARVAARRARLLPRWLCRLGYSIGLERDDLNRLIERSRPPVAPPRSVRWCREWLRRLTSPATPLCVRAARPASDRRAAPATPSSRARATARRRREPFLPGPPQFEPANRSIRRPSRMPSAGCDQGGAACGIGCRPTICRTGRDDGFDDSTDAESRAIAKRFAPASAAAACS